MIGASDPRKRTPIDNILSHLVALYTFGYFNLF